MSQLELAFLGKPLVYRAGELCTFPTRKTLALLIYLTVEGGIQSRDKITALFWPESDPTRARATFRKTLAMLRDVLREQADHPFLVTDRDSVYFDFAAGAELDLHQLHAAAQSTRELPLAASAAARVSEWIAKLARAAQLYRGDFLEGWTLDDAPEFDDWVSVQREACHRQAALVLDWLGQLQFESGDSTGALETTARWIAHDPLNEVAHRRLIQLHLAEGQRAAALAAYENCRMLLERELNAEPSAETIALAERARSQVLDVPARKYLAAETQIPFVGRAAEHTQLAQLYQLARHSSPQAVLLQGEPGIGKTRLAQEFLAWVSAQGAEVLDGRAFETSATLPYLPVLEAVRERIAREPNPRRWLSDLWLAELSRLLPELRERLPDLPAPLPVAETDARTRLFEAFTRLGQALALSAPLVVCVDDIQWADAASLDLLYFALRRWTRGKLPVLLILAVRAEELGSNLSLQAWINRLSRELTFTPRPLDVLSFEDTRRLAEGMGLADIKLQEQLFNQTQGQPFYVVETLKAGVERGEAQIPNSVQDLIRTRLSHLSANAQALSTAAAIFGARFDAQQARRIANLDQEQGVTALEELTTRGIVRETGAEYVFSHDKIREVIDCRTSRERRRLLHGRALDLLETSGAPAAQLARHAFAAGRIERALDLSIAAGDQAMQVFAVREAIRHYEQANAAMSRTDTRWERLNVQLGHAYELANEWDKARAAYQALLEFARAAHNAELQVTVLTSLATVAINGNVNIEAAVPMLQQARELAEASPNKVGLAEVEWNLAQIAFYQRENALSAMHSQRALELAQELNDSPLIAKSLNMLVYAELQQGQVALAESHARAARALYAGLGNRAMEADCLCQVATACIRSGKLDTAMDAARAANAISLEIENVWGQANSAKELAMVLAERGDYANALRISQAAVALCLAEEMIPLLGMNSMVLGVIQRALGEAEAAHGIHLQVKQIAEQHGSSFFAGWVEGELCADAAAAGNWQAAHDYARAALALRNYDASFSYFARWNETRALVRGGDYMLAEQDIQRWGENIGNNPRYELDYLRALAVLAQARRDTDRALEYLNRAARLAEEMSLPVELTQVHADMLGV